jgi:hypothetical protein
LKEEGTSERFLVSEYDNSLRFVFFVVSIEVFSRNLIGFLILNIKTRTCGTLRIHAFWQFYRYKTDITAFPRIQKYRYVGDVRNRFAVAFLTETF